MTPSWCKGRARPSHASGSHFERFCAIREEFRALKSANPAFEPAHPAATNPVLRRPPRPEGRVWIEHEPSIATVDLANAAYGLMLRLLAYAFAVPAPHPDKALAMDLAIGLMQAVSPLGERAARLPAGPSNPQCHAGMSFTNLRDAAPFPPGSGAKRFFIERLLELAGAAAALSPQEDDRIARSARAFASLAQRAVRRFDLSSPAPAAAPPASALPTSTATKPAASAAMDETTTLADGVETVEGRDLTLMFEAKRCIHARFCVTGAPAVFLANVKGPWIHPNAMDTERLTDIAHACPSGAIRYQRKDGRPDEAAPPVNLAAIREGGPYADARSPTARWHRDRISRHAVSVRSVEEQALLRQLAPRGGVFGNRRTPERQHRYVAGA